MIVCSLFLILLLLFPEITGCGSKNGLFLWATVLVPSLLPFSVLTSLLRTKLAKTRWKWILLVAGLLSGYPIGAKVVTDLYHDGALSYEQCLFFLCSINNPSPMFVLSFVGDNILHLGTGKYLFYLCLVFSSFLSSFCLMQLLRFHAPNRTTACSHTDSNPSFIEEWDTQICNSALLLIKIGGYIMFFSILTEFINHLIFLPVTVRLPLCGLLEITTGNVMINTAGLSPHMQIILSLAFTAFGGLCATAQTNSGIRNTGLSIFPYLGAKLLSAIFAALFGFIFW